MATDLSLQDELNAIITGAVDEAIGAYRRYLDNPVAAPAAKAPEARVTKAVSAAKPKAPPVTRQCPVEGCTKAGRGPRFGWRCEDHRAAWQAERAAQMKAESSQSSPS